VVSLTWPSIRDLRAMIVVVMSQSIDDHVTKLKLGYFLCQPETPARWQMLLIATFPKMSKLLIMLRVISSRQERTQFKEASSLLRKLARVSIDKRFETLGDLILCWGSITRMSRGQSHHGIEEKHSLW
jgi:hypothetical protein